MQVQNVNNRNVYPTQTTNGKANNTQAASAGIPVEDPISISDEAQQLSDNTEREEISFLDYMIAVSDFGENSYWAALESMLKPSYITGANEYNIDVATQAARQLVSEATDRGYNLDLDETRVSIERMLWVDWANATDEAYEMGLLDGLKLRAIYPYDHLTDADRSILGNMHNDAVKNGLDIKQVDLMAQHLGLTRLLSDSSPDMESVEFDAQYISQLIEGIEERGYNMFDAETLQCFLNNFGAYKL